MNKSAPPAPSPSPYITICLSVLAQNSCFPGFLGIFSSAPWAAGPARGEHLGEGRGTCLGAPSGSVQTTSRPGGLSERGREGEKVGAWASQSHGPRRLHAALGPAAKSGAPGGGGPRPDVKPDRHPDRDAADQLTLWGPSPQPPEHKPHRPDLYTPEGEGKSGG